MGWFRFFGTIPLLLYSVIIGVEAQFVMFSLSVPASRRDVRSMTQLVGNLTTGAFCMDAESELISMTGMIDEIYPRM